MLKHFEYVFLLAEAHMLRNLVDKAKKEGGTFHPVKFLHPLKNGLYAHARIEDKNDEKVLVLRLKHPSRAINGELIINKTAKAFFEGNYEQGAISKNEDWVFYEFHSSHIQQPNAIYPDAHAASAAKTKS